VSSVRRQGWIELREHITPGSVSIAAPVLVRDGLAVAAVSLVGSASEDMRALIPAVLTTARGIARALGRDEQPIGAARRA
jgi:DNA-binding IclR family transcriptional regulator